MLFPSVLSSLAVGNEGSKEFFETVVAGAGEVAGDGLGGAEV